MRGLLQTTLALASILFLATPQSVRADATVFWDFEGGFDPRTVVIGPGEKVTWINFDIYNIPVTITLGDASVDLDFGQSAMATFPNLGTYPFSSNYGDFGSVVVTVPPSISITNPVSDSVFLAPATFEIQTTNSDGVNLVEFWLDSGAGPEFLTDDFDPPFTCGVTNLPAGHYTLTAYGYDNYSQAVAWVEITVNDVAPVITLSNPRFAGGQFLFEGSGFTIGKTNVLQQSTNAVAWSSIATNVAEVAACTFTNSVTGNARFLRVLELSPAGN